MVSTMVNLHFARAAALSAVLLGVACSGSQQPAPAPKYTPVNSPEPATKCPDLRKSAQKAREAALEKATPAARSNAAKAVFAHAECERRQFNAARLDGASHEKLLGSIRAARDLYTTARNLYREVPNHGDATMTVGALASLGELHARYADKLRGVHTPADMTSVAEKAAFLRQLSELATQLDNKAARAFAEAIKASANTNDPHAARWVAAACAGLAIVDSGNSARKQCP